MSGDVNPKVLKNASWIIVCRIAQSVLALVVSSLSARYLGPANFGIINYSAALVAFALPITQLGLNCTLVKEIVAAPDNEERILGTSVAMSCISAVISVLGIYLYSVIANGDERTTVLVSLLYSVSLFFQAGELIIYWFQAHYLSKYVSLVSLGVYIAVSAYKIYLLSTEKCVEWFAISNAIDYLLISTVLYIVYRKLGGKRFAISFSVGKRLLQGSGVYIVSGLMAVIYAQTDRIMLKNIVDDTETGLYSAAITCAGLMSFVFTAIIDSMRPYIFEAKSVDHCEYELRITKLYSVIIYLSIAYSLFCTLFGKIIIWILYGYEYLSATKLLRILVWYTAFTYYGGAQGVWMLGENKQKYLPILGATGAVLNLFLNALLIPQIQAVGAAIATLITAIVSNVLLCCIIRPLRGTIRILVRALRPKCIISIIIGILQRKG